MAVSYTHLDVYKRQDEILGRFIDLSKIEELFGKMQEAQYGVQQGYSTGLTFENKPWHMSISWHEYLQTMGILSLIHI